MPRGVDKSVGSASAGVDERGKSPSPARPAAIEDEVKGLGAQIRGVPRERSPPPSFDQLREQNRQTGRCYRLECADPCRRLLPCGPEWPARAT